MVGQDMSSVEAVSLGSLSKKRFLAGLLMRKVIKAQYIHESNRAKTGQNYTNTMRLDA